MGELQRGEHRAALYCRLGISHSLEHLGVRRQGGQHRAWISDGEAGQAELPSRQEWGTSGEAMPRRSSGGRGWGREKAK